MSETGPPDEGVGRNAVFALALQLATSAFTAALTLFLVRALEPRGYGLFALAVAVGALVMVPSDFGISQSAARFIAERRGRADAVAAVLRDAIALKLVASGLLSLVLAAAAGSIADALEESPLVWPIRAIAAAVFAQSFFLLFQYALVAQGRISLSFRAGLLSSSVELGATVAIVLLGAGTTGAVLGRTAGYAAGALAGIWALSRMLGRAPRVGLPDRQSLRRLASYAGALAVIDGAWTLFNQTSILLIGAFAGAATVGVFQAPLRLIVLFHYPGHAIASAVAPRLARHEESAQDVAAFNRALRGLIVFQASLVPPLVVWATPLTVLALGPGYEESADVLRALAPFVFLSGLAPLVSLTANYLGEARRRIPIAIAVVVVNLALGLILIPRHGAIGAAVGLIVSYAIYVPAHVWICRRFVPIPLGRLSLTFTRAFLAAAAMAGVLALAGTDELSLVDWPLGALGGAVAFAGVLVLTREVTLGELRRGWNALAVYASRRR